MKEIELKDFQKISLEMLKSIHTYCVENNINYSLGYGTLIGAIRHNGFIPWDDDIDIVMPRPDYERFIRNFNGSYEYFRVLAPELDWNYYALHANVYDNRTLLVEPRSSHRGFEIGVKIDIFPLDGTPNDNNKYLSMCRKFYFYNRVLLAKRRPLAYSIKESFCKTAEVCVVKLLSSLFSYSYLQKKIHEIATTHNYDNSELVDNLVYSAYFGKRHPKVCYDNYITVPFENYKFMVASGYDLILRTIYGDYMKLPPEQQRVTHHTFKAYWR